MKPLVNDFNLTAETYEILYKRFLTRPPGELLDYAWPIKDKVVLDLCAGPMGRVAVEACRMGAKGVAAVDLDPHVKELRKINKRIIPYCVPLNAFLRWRGGAIDMENRFGPAERGSNRIFDVAICQQGINYWFNKTNIRGLSRILRKRGVFVFNTFNRCPNKGVTRHDYIIEGRSYMEVYQRIDNIVHHVQFVDGLPPHYASFMWIPRSTFMEILKPVFSDVEVKTASTTDIYICRK